MFRVTLRVQDREVPAVVDTTAQVTLISSELFSMLRDPPPVKREVVMKKAGMGL